MNSLNAIWNIVRSTIEWRKKNARDNSVIFSSSQVESKCCVCIARERSCYSQCGKHYVVLFVLVGVVVVSNISDHSSSNNNSRMFTWIRHSQVTSFFVAFCAALDIFHYHVHRNTTSLNVLSVLSSAFVFFFLISLSFPL